MFRTASIFAAVALLAILPAIARAADDPDDEDDQPNLIVTADFNHDGIMDIAEAVANPHDPSAPYHLEIQLGQKDGSFRSAQSNTEVGRKPQSLVVGDFNHDGIPDLIVANRDGSLLEFLGDGSGQFTSAGEIAHLSSISSITIGKFSRDGAIGLAVADSLSSTVTIYLGAPTSPSGPTSTQASFRAAWSFALPMRGKTYRLASADFNSDGISDLAITQDGDEGDYQVLIGNGNGTFTFSADLSKLADPSAHCVT